MQTNFTDMLGRPVTVGAKIAYPTASGSSAAEVYVPAGRTVTELSGGWTWRRKSGKILSPPELLSVCDPSGAMEIEILCEVYS